MRSKFTLFLAVALVFGAIETAFSQTPTPRRGPGRGQGTAGPGGAPQMGPMGSAQQVTLKPYEEVVTKEAKTSEGLFKVHRIGSKVLWEISPAVMGRVFLWQTEVAQVPAGGAYPGSNVGTHVLTFERHENTIYVRKQNYDVRSEAKDGVDVGVKMANVAPIILSFSMEAEAKDKSAVIDVTRLFTSDQAPFSAGGVVGSSGVDLGRSYIDRISVFPTNIETRSWLTFSSPTPKTALIHYSLVALPEKPMMPRYRDDRVGFFGTSYTAYGRAEEKAVNQTIIDRFRLEKKDPSAALSEPKKPIVYYLAREVPEKYRSYLHRGVEAWQAAFEKAGFKNAIICKDAPSEKEDPDWNPEDARYSVIRWAPSTIANAMGPHVADPRSGETISAHIIVWHNVLNLVQQWYFSQASALDPRARKFPFNDELMGRLIEYVVSHEVGHTLGLEHNFKASTAWTIDQLRTPGFVSKNGVAASIMSYSRFNYVGQPGDNLGKDDLLGRIGPYDLFAIQWGYTPIPGANSPDAEKPLLDAWAAQQLAHPELQFGNYAHQEDPTTQSECIGEDPVAAAVLGLKNIEREAGYLLQATFNFGENFDGLREAYNTLVGQRNTELNRAMRYVGGVVESNVHVGHGAKVFTHVAKDRQKAVVKLITNQGLHFPAALLEPSIIVKAFPSGDVSRVTSRQAIMINSLLGETRLNRMLDNEVQNGSKAYTIAELATDLQNGVWEELDSAKPSIDIFRRSIQSSYLVTVDGRINGATATRTDLGGIERDLLRGLAVKIDKAIPRAANEATARHLRESRRVISLIMDGKYVQPTGGGVDVLSMLFGIQDTPSLGCGRP